MIIDQVHFAAVLSNSGYSVEEFKQIAIVTTWIGIIRACFAV
jgi:hypothetical protein